MFQHFSKYLQRKPGGFTIDFSGIWVNELGSEMELTVQEGRVNGTYRTGVGRASPTERFELTGFASRDRIVLCVKLEPTGLWARGLACTVRRMGWRKFIPYGISLGIFKMTKRPRNTAGQRF